MTPTSKQSTTIAVFFVILVGAIVVTALAVYQVDDFLKVWAVIGTLVGVVTGAIPSFFFSRAAAAAQETAQQANVLRTRAEEKSNVVLGLADRQLLDQAEERRPDLFREPAS
jgi:hypothetical protein